jgi:hypothetical protein
VPHSKKIQYSQQIVWPLVLIGGIIGLLLSWTVLSGDHLGRVNIFYLLLVYLFIPVLSILFSIFSLVFGKGCNLARITIAIPFWSLATQSLLRKSQQLNLDKYWFLMQSQAAAIAFSIASLACFFTLLIATDLNFVWRSTILEPTDVLPLLEIVAWPWQFWSSAQPSLGLLEMTQDSRLVSSSIDNQSYGAWWKFILATQICYSLLLRVILLFITKLWLERKVNSDIELILQSKISCNKPLSNFEEDLAVVSHHLPEDITSLNWDNTPTSVWELIEGNKSLTDKNSPANRHQTIELDDEQLVIVKSWEPPLGELDDYLSNGYGYVQPVDWDSSGLVKLQTKHLHEWQRFITKLPKWKLYVPIKYMPKE